MSVNISKFLPSSGYYPDISKSVIQILWTDTAPFYDSFTPGQWRYGMTFYLWSASSSGTRLVGLYTYYETLYSDPGSGDYNGNASFDITIPDGTAPGLYYVGGPTTGTRKALTVEIPVSNINIVFSINGGTGTAPNSQTKESGSSFTMPNGLLFSKAGYTFLGWSTTSNATVAAYLADTSYTFNATDTLYAVWDPNTYNVLIDEDGGDAVDNKNYITDTSSQDVAIDIPDGKVFASWAITTQPTPTLTTPFTGTTLALPANTYGTIELRANWVVADINFHINEGTGTEPSIISQDAGTSFTMPNDSGFYRDGYDFLGWSTSSGATAASFLAGSSYTFNATDTLYAVWDPKTYNIVINENGGDSVANTSYETTNALQNITVPIPTGKVFASWSVTAQPTPSLSSPFTGTNLALPADTYGYIELRANWVSATISFNKNGGSGTTPSNQTKDAGSLFTMPSSSGFYKNGYSFLGWSTSSGASSPSYTSGNSYTFNATDTLYAVWDSNFYNIVINENGGGTVDDEYYYTDTSSQNVTIDIPTPPSGYYFDYWSVTSQPSENITSPFVGTNLAIPADAYGYVEIRPTWAYLTYYITYNLGGGTGAHGNPASYNVGTSTFNLVQGSLTKTGYSFSGWYTAASGGTKITSITQGSIGDRELYAQWGPLKYTLNFKNEYTDDDSILVSEIMQTSEEFYNAAIIYSGGIPEKIVESDERYVFIGWNTDINATVALGSFGNMPTSTKTFYAIYTKYKSGFKSDSKDVNVIVGDEQASKIYQGDTVIWEDFH